MLDTNVCLIYEFIRIEVFGSPKAGKNQYRNKTKIQHKLPSEQENKKATLKCM